VRVVFAAALLLASLACSAELPPYVYEKQQREAPEAVVLRVRSVTVGADVVAEAQVEKVKRSQTGLKAGDTIRIRYENRQNHERRPGPGAVPVLEKGQRYEAYLAGAGRTFEPAAGARSFVAASASSSAAPASR
jgi:hypothetical protein